jgi:hypothetical protein
MIRKIVAAAAVPVAAVLLAACGSSGGGPTVEGCAKAINVEVAAAQAGHPKYDPRECKGLSQADLREAAREALQAWLRGQS